MNAELGNLIGVGTVDPLSFKTAYSVKLVPVPCTVISVSETTSFTLNLVRLMFTVLSFTAPA